MLELSGSTASEFTAVAGQVVFVASIHGPPLTWLQMPPSVPTSSVGGLVGRTAVALTRPLSTAASPTPVPFTVAPTGCQTPGTGDVARAAVVAAVSSTTRAVSQTDAPPS